MRFLNLRMRMGRRFVVGLGFNLSLCLVGQAFAGWAALAEGHGAPAAGGEAEGAPAAPAVPKDQKEFVEKTTKLNTLTSKISESEKHFAELVHHKNETKSAAAKQKIIHEMNEVSKQRNLDVDAYEALKSDLELRYPNQGIVGSRRYETQTKRSVEELEGVAGLDELLTRTKKIVEKKFAPFMKDEPKKTATKKHLASEPGATELPRLRLEK